MSPEMFEALLKIMDYKINTHLARDSWDGGMHEYGQESDAIEAFKKEFIDGTLSDQEPSDNA